MDKEIYNEFDSAFAERGGAFNVEVLEGIEKLEMEIVQKELQEFINSIPRRSDANHLPKAYVGIVNNTSMNAGATKGNGKYFIGINIGTIYMIRDIFSQLVFAYDQSTNSSINQGTLSSELKLDLDYLDYRDFISNNQLPSSRPLLSPAQQSVGLLMTYFALQFLVIHEYGHIIFGHVDFMTSLNKKKTYSELNSNNIEISEKHNLDNQAIEMDADYYAAQIAVKELDLFHKNMHLINNEDFRKLYTDEKELFKIWFFSINTFFRIFANAKVDLENFINNTHPPAFLRQFYIFLNFDNVYQIINKYKKGNDLDPKVSEYIYNIYSESITNIDFAFDQVTSNTKVKISTELSIRQKAHDHFKLITAHFKIVNKQLKQFTFDK